MPPYLHASFLEMTSMSMTRRQWLAVAGMAGVGLFGSTSRVLAGPKANPKVLFFTKSAGFEHSVIARKENQLGHAETILMELGKAAGIDVTCSKDGRLFEPDQIGEWDAFAFYTSGDLTKTGTDGQPPMSSKGEQAFYEAIEDGKGLVGFHCATDTFGHHRGKGADDPYIQLIGGEFSGHGPQQVAKFKVTAPDFPGVQEFGTEFELLDEWYGQKHLNDDLRVVIVQRTEGMKGRDYQRPDYPMTWVRRQGKGRVFYTSMGHREDVWTNPKFQSLAIGGLKFALGLVEANVPVNVAEVTPGYREWPN